MLTVAAAPRSSHDRIGQSIRDHDIADAEMI